MLPLVADIAGNAVLAFTTCNASLPHAMHRSDILNSHREYSKMNDAERISTTYIPSNRYLKRKRMDKR